MKLADIKGRLDAFRNQLRGTLGPDATPLEIRAAVLDAIEDRVEAVGRGRRKFPYGRVAIRVLMRSAADKTSLETVFADLDERVAERFGEIRCDRPAGLDLDVSYLTSPPADWAADQLFEIDCEQRAAGDAAAAPAPSTPTVRVQVLKGTATKKAYTFNDTTILVGRTAEARDAHGRRRRNHVAFADSNTTVSRAHARLKYDAARRRYQILDEGSVHGTAVIRSGETIEVMKRDPRGVLVQSGDEIQFGDASVKIVID